MGVGTERISKRAEMGFPNETFFFFFLLNRCLYEALFKLPVLNPAHFHK